MSQRPPFDLGITSQLVPQRAPETLSHRLFRAAVVGVITGLIWKRFGHIKLVRVLFAAPIACMLALAPVAAMSFLAFVADTELLDKHAPPAWVWGIVVGVVWLFFAIRWTAKLYRRLTRQST